MITVEQVDTQSEAQVRRFVNFPYRLYADHPHWLPPPYDTAALYLNRQQHPFYHHSDADFFIAVRDGRDVARLAVLENRPHNQANKTHEAWFYLFDGEDDLTATGLLFEHAADWARARHLDKLEGPKGFTLLDGIGMLVEGFEYPQPSTMTSYNYDYYPRLLESLGFEGQDPLLSYHVEVASFQLPAWINDIATWVQQHHDLTIQSFANLEEMLPWASHLLQMGQAMFSSVGAGSAEAADAAEMDAAVMIELVVKAGLMPQFTKLILHRTGVVGAVFGYANLSTALRRTQGHLSLDDLFQEIQQARGVIINGFGFLPNFRLQGLNAFLLVELEKTARAMGIQTADLIQTSVPVQRDFATVGIQPRQKHRTYSLYL
ncbi:MAG: hypothetical protein Fur0044_01010 [Anaerolineae bacterium]